MSKKIKPHLMKGLRDFLPQDMIKRNYVVEKIVSVFKKHGFLPLETPAIEMWKTLSGKYGEEGERLIYRFKDRGDRDLGLRYDLTVPLSRVVAMHQNEILFPLKRYQIQPVWRADKPGKGRFREFYQCDVDVVGSADLLSDAEVIKISWEALHTLGFKNFYVKVNSRKILRGIVEVSGCPISMEMDLCRAIDKKDKIGIEGVKKEMERLEIPPSCISKILEIIEVKGSTLEVEKFARKTLANSTIALEGIEEISKIFKYLKYMGVPENSYVFDLSLARGLDYYTGAIYEGVVDEPKIGSLTGGGRFDQLIGYYLGRDIPAVGNSIGLERIITVMDELNMYPKELGFGVDVMICRIPDEDLEYSISILEELRKKGLNCEIYLGKKGLRGQIGYANDKRIPVVLIAGRDEVDAKEVTLKDMERKEQRRISRQEVAEHVREIISKQRMNL